MMKYKVFHGFWVLCHAFSIQKIFFNDYTFFLIILCFICKIHIFTALEIYMGSKSKVETQLYFSPLASQ